MTIPDYLEQVVVSGYGRSKAGLASKHGGLSARSSTTALLWAGFDYVCALIAGLIAFRIRQHAYIAPIHPGLFDQFWMSIPLISVVYVALFGLYLVVFARIYGLYRAADHRSGLNEQRMTVQAVLTAGLLLCGTLYVTHAYAVSRIVVALTLLLTMSAMMMRRAISPRLAMSTDSITAITSERVRTWVLRISVRLRWQRTPVPRHPGSAPGQ